MERTQGGAGGRIPEKYFSKKAGKKRSAVETKNFAQGARTAVPVLTVRGEKPGPAAAILAGQHGREINGIAAIEKAFNKLDPRRMSGRVVFLPVMNPIGIRLRQQDYPSEFARKSPNQRYAPEIYNMNRSWADEKICDNYSYEVSSVVWDTFIRHVCAVADFHAWSQTSISASMSAPENRDFLMRFGLPWCWITQGRKRGGKTFTLRNACRKAGIPSLTCELAPQNVLDIDSVGHGERCIYNMLIYLGILQGEPEIPDIQYEFRFDSRHDIVTSPVGGLVVTDFRKGEIVRKGDTVLRVLSLDSLKTSWKYDSPVDSFVYAIGAVAEYTDFYSVVHPGQNPAVLVRPEKFAVKLDKSPGGGQAWHDFSSKNMDILRSAARRSAEKTGARL